MLTLAIVLLVIGIVLLLAPVPFANADTVGWLLAILGAILLLVALLSGSISVNDAEAAAWR